MQVTVSLVALLLGLLQVNSFGTLSFSGPFLDFPPQRFPIPFDGLIAPFWSSNDNRFGGQILYRFTDNQTVLDAISANISAAFDTNFYPVTAFIVTWNQVSDIFGPVDLVS